MIVYETAAIFCDPPALSLAGFACLRADDGWRTFEVKTRAEILNPRV